MLPATEKTLLPALRVETVAQAPSRTYGVDWVAGRVRGMTDGREAMEQTVRKVLSTMRFNHLIYSWNYGTEWGLLLGRSRPVVESELKRVLREALTRDGRVTDVTDVTLSWTGRRTCHAAFTVKTVFGEVREEAEVHV